MIVIEAVFENNTVRPLRLLTDDEKKTIIFTKIDGTNYNYYQIGDEIPTQVEQDNDIIYE